LARRAAVASRRSPSVSVSATSMPERSASMRTASGKVRPSIFMMKSMLPPLSLQPKQWKKPRSGLTWKLGVFSLWKGQRPVNERPRRVSFTVSPMRATRSVRSLTCAMVSAEIMAFAGASGRA
jgi:hypothetical protein